MSPTEPRRADAGVTLVETLVVLVLIGTVAGAVGLGVGSAARGTGARDEALILAARLDRASEEAVLSGAAVALLWTEDSYRFVAMTDGDWAPHPIALLAEPRVLDGGVRLESEGAFAVTASALPAEGPPLLLDLRAGNDAVAVTWDGAAAVVAAP